EVTRIAGAGCGADPAAWPVSQQTAYGYTVNGDLKTQQTWNSATQGEASLLEEHTVTYLTVGGVYLNGNRLSDQLRLKGPDSECAGVSPCTTTYDYDARERLVRTDNGLPNGFRATVDYTLDGQAGLPLLGNVTREIERWTKASGAVDRTVVDSSYNAASQLLTSRTVLDSYSGTEPGLPAAYNPDLDADTWYRWNQANGNLKCETSSAAVTLADCHKPEAERPATLIEAWYQFDVRDRMTQYMATEDRSSYVYDGADRVAKQWEQHTRGTETRARDTDYTYLGLSGEVVRETHWNALNKQPYEAVGQSGLLQRTRGYGYDAYDRRATLTNTPNGDSASSYSYARNVHGDISLLLSSTGTATAAYGYTAYGAEETGLTTDVESTAGTGFEATEPLNAFRFNDKRYDTGSLSIDMGARRYGPDTGRFLQNDYYRGALDDLRLAEDALTQNRYAFAGCNPVSLVEADGHEPVNALERRWCLSAPWYSQQGASRRLQCVQARADARSAREVTERLVEEGLFGAVPGTHDGPADAFRHCYWSGLMTLSMSAATAKGFTDRHEFGTAPPPKGKEGSAQRRTWRHFFQMRHMDLYNNAVGRAIAEQVERDHLTDDIRRSGGSTGMVDARQRIRLQERCLKESRKGGLLRVLCRGPGCNVEHPDRNPR
ncbi:MAG TPA: RHS repeat-associated core domain-containing protein, partial [Gemmatimonadaceae bacterium]|nr:RHS repeat-associated core domain-containing protein [Gemmatimonadaceae bacterium]